jgi:hypothetical protein
VLDEFERLGTHVEFVPPGYTGILQVMDVGLMRPFKDIVRAEFERFMIEHGNDERPSRLTVAGWVDRAWTGITTDTILNTWARCMDSVRLLRSGLLQVVQPAVDNDEDINEQQILLNG